MGEEISTRDLIEQGFESVNLRIDDQVGHLRRDMHRMHRSALRFKRKSRADWGQTFRASGTAGTSSETRFRM
jgi:hypothetical protein